VLNKLIQSVNKGRQCKKYEYKKVSMSSRSYKELQRITKEGLNDVKKS